jgi:hypothetical protein
MAAPRFIKKNLKKKKFKKKKFKKKFQKKNFKKKIPQKFLKIKKKFMPKLLRM